MSLPERMYQSLQEGRLPKVYPAKTLVQRTQGIAQTLRTRRGNVRNLTTKLVRPLAARKAVAITDPVFSGYTTSAWGFYLIQHGSELSYKIDYKSQFVRPTLAKLVQSIGDVEKTSHVLFLPNATYTETVKKVISQPTVLTCAASAFSERGWIKYDALSEEFGVGVFNDTYKPAAEYPVSGVDNAILDLSYSWKKEDKIYPLPLPSGLSIYNLSAWPSFGPFFYGGKSYKNPTTDNFVDVQFTVKNDTGKTIDIEHWGAIVSVMYEDNQRVSQYNPDVQQPAVSIGSGGTRTYIYSVPLADWCYGKVAIAHAMNVYKEGMLIYGGGPLWQFEIFRVLLP